MASSQRVQVLTDGSDLLKVLGEFLKNPKLIEELAAEVVKLNEITDQQSADLHKALTTIQQKDETAAELKKLRETIAAETSAHIKETEKRVAEFNTYIENNEKILADKKAELDAREADLNDYALRLDQRENQLKEKAATVHGLFQ